MTDADTRLRLNLCTPPRTFDGYTFTCASKADGVTTWPCTGSVEREDFPRAICTCECHAAMPVQFDLVIPVVAEGLPPELLRALRNPDVEVPGEEEAVKDIMRAAGIVEGAPGDASAILAFIRKAEMGTAYTQETLAALARLDAARADAERRAEEAVTCEATDTADACGACLTCLRAIHASTQRALVAERAARERAERERDALRDRLDEYKRAVTDRLHYDMQSVLSPPPLSEQWRATMTAQRNRLAAFEAATLRLRTASDAEEPNDDAISDASEALYDLLEAPVSPLSEAVRVLTEALDRVKILAADREAFVMLGARAFVQAEQIAVAALAHPAVLAAHGAAPTEDR